MNRVKSKSHCHDVATTKVDSDSVDGTHFDINYEEGKNDVSISPMYTLFYLYLMYEYSIVQQLIMMMRGVGMNDDDEVNVVRMSLQPI